MKKLLNWAISIILIAAAIALGMRAYQGFKEGDPEPWLEEVPASQTNCYTLADAGQCLCQHVETGRRVALAYEECIARATNSPRP